MTSETTTIDYEALAQEAMRGVVRTVLARTAKSGLTGDHHFYISFDTESPGVMLSKRLKEKYPREMTIVLQHRFWDLAVTDDRFEVKLTFDGIPERLVVPLTAIKVFFDPSVRYGLQFDEPGSEPLPGSTIEDLTRAGTPRPGARKVTRSPRKPRLEPAPSDNATEKSAPAAVGKPAAVAPLANGKDAADDPSADKTVVEKPANGGGAEIVSLDKFRKK